MLSDAMDNCLKCSVCTTACPVMGVLPEYPGPKRLGPDLERMRREGVAADTDWVEYCLGCHRCDLACPHQVPVSELIARAKATHRKPMVRGLRDWWFSRPGLLGRLGTIFPAGFNFFLKLRMVRWGMGRFMRIAPQRTFPSYVRQGGKQKGAADASQTSVLLFPGCFVRYNEPEMAERIVALLGKSSVRVEMAKTECCGVPAIANGDAALAHSLAIANTRILAAKVKAGIRIVTACSSCGHMLKTGFGGALQGDAELSAEARAIAENTYDLAEYLIGLADEGRLNTDFKTVELHVAYHAPCHQKSQGMGRPWYQLLRRIPRVRVEDLDAGCCGMSGTYGFKQEKYKTSMAIGQPLFARIAQTQPQLVTTECATCRMQIEHGSHKLAVHPLDILLQAYEGQSPQNVAATVADCGQGDGEGRPVCR